MNKKTETIGARLKKVRNEKGLSLEEVYSKTRIHTRVLEAIEENRAEEVLSRVYIKSFLKEYTRCLGLDWDELEKTFLTKAEPVPVKIPEKTIPLPEPVQSLPLSKTKIDFKKFQVLKKGKEIKLTAAEFKVLKLLISSKDEPVSRHSILAEIWTSEEVTTRTVDTHIWSLREKLEDDPSKPKHIHTVHRIGYKFVG